MVLLEWIRFFLGAAFLLGGIIVFAIELFGVFRFKYVLNRMHAAALGDTMGLALCMIGLIIMNGFDFTAVKMILVIVLLWITSPVASHMISRFEVTTNENFDKVCEDLSDMKSKEK